MRVALVELREMAERDEIRKPVFFINAGRSGAMADLDRSLHLLEKRRGCCAAAGSHRWRIDTLLSKAVVLRWHSKVRALEYTPSKEFTNEPFGTTRRHVRRRRAVRRVALAQSLHRQTENRTRANAPGRHESAHKRPVQLITGPAQVIRQAF